MSRHGQLIGCVMLLALAGCDTLPPDLSDPGDPLGGQPLPPADSDDDGVADDDDNCVLVANADQTDTDGDGVGDVCTLILDTDGDGIPDGEDNCLFAANPDQVDGDKDGIGDACDSIFDSDGDWIADSEDNCPSTANLDQADTDGDGLGDACDDDDDNDGLDDDEESLIGTDPLNPDTDGDGLTDAEEVLFLTDPIDPDTDGDGLYDWEEVMVWGTNPLNLDTDGDSLLDGTEVALLLDPLVPNPTGFVDRVYCSDFVAVSGLPGLLDIGMYENTSFLSSFLLWQAGDFVARDFDTGRLVNITLMVGTAASWLGNRSVFWNDIGIFDIALDRSWIELIDATLWLVHWADQVEVWDWLLSDDVTLIQPKDALDWWRMLNTDMCEYVRVE